MNTCTDKPKFIGPAIPGIWKVYPNPEKWEAFTGPPCECSKLQEYVHRVTGPALFNSFEPLTHHCNLANNLFYWYYFGRHLN